MSSFQEAITQIQGLEDRAMEELMEIVQQGQAALSSPG